jgi:hypothetical protein
MTRYEAEFRAEFPTAEVRREWGHLFMIYGAQHLFTWKDLFRYWRLPYGLWTCEGGREVLFNRFYRPIWQRWPVVNGDPAEWVRDWNEQRWFFTGNPLHLPVGRVRMLETVLRDFGAGLDVRGYLEVREAD